MTLAARSMTAPPRPVLHLMVSTRPGGAPRQVELLAAGLRARGWLPIVGAPADGMLFESFRTMGIETVRLATNRLRPATLVRVLRLVRRRRVALIHSHGKGAGVYGRVAARLTGVPAVHTLHGIHFERYGPAARRAYLALERRLSSWTARVVNVSREQEREGLALGLFDARQSRVIVNGVDTMRLAATALTRAEARAALKVPADACVVGTVARFDEVKRLDLLLEAVARLPGVTAVLVGAGSESARLRALASARGLGGRVVFAGEVEDGARLLRAIDVYATASRKEGMPLAVLEAMALGLPVVASDIPAHREILGPASRGLAAETVDGFTAILHRVLGDGGLRAALGCENRRRARNEFDAREMLDAVEALYAEVLGR
ncbi:MAG TPA: glycosyltransferase [Acidimicrobiales bacterium]|nr:glycosyltransferase [Acidimicrobiales bacterium]